MLIVNAHFSDAASPADSLIVTAVDGYNGDILLPCRVNNNLLFSAVLVTEPIIFEGTFKSCIFFF